MVLAPLWVWESTVFVVHTRSKGSGMCVCVKSLAIIADVALALTQRAEVVRREVSKGQKGTMNDKKKSRSKECFVETASWKKVYNSPQRQFEWVAKCEKKIWNVQIVALSIGSYPEAIGQSIRRLITNAWRGFAYWSASRDRQLNWIVI